MVMNKSKLTSVKILEDLYKRFKSTTVNTKMTLQKLTNRSINLYLTDDQYKQKSLPDFFPGIKKIQNLDKYSSDVVQKLSKDELKKIITESKLISK